MCFKYRKLIQACMDKISNQYFAQNAVDFFVKIMVPTGPLRQKIKFRLNRPIFKALYENHFALCGHFWPLLNII